MEIIKKKKQKTCSEFILKGKYEKKFTLFMSKKKKTDLSM